jgi:hypothetical protein
MTPRHLAIFCLAQLASIAGVILCVYQSRKFYALQEVAGIKARPFPWHYEAMIEYGWLLIAVPIACVLIIPRHCEDEALVNEDWRWYGRAAAASGAAVIALAPCLGFPALMTVFTGPGLTE